MSDEKKIEIKIGQIPTKEAIKKIFKELESQPLQEEVVLLPSGIDLVKAEQELQGGERKLKEWAGDMREQQKNLNLPEGTDLVANADGQLEEHSCTNSKCLEFREVSALVCLDIDTLVDVLDDFNSLDELKAHVQFVKKEKDRLLKDDEYRKGRYESASFLFSLVEAL